MIATQKQAAAATSSRAFTTTPVAVRRAQAVRVRATEPQSAAGPNTTTTAEGIIPRTTQDVSVDCICALGTAAAAVHPWTGFLPLLTQQLTAALLLRLFLLLLLRRPLAMLSSTQLVRATCTR
jgi:hypothetical protein